MEIVSWKTTVGEENVYQAKHWEKFRNTKGKYKGFLKEYSSKSKLMQALTIAATVIWNYKKL